MVTKVKVKVQWQIQEPDNVHYSAIHATFNAFSGGTTFCGKRIPKGAWYGRGARGQKNPVICQKCWQGPKMTTGLRQTLLPKGLTNMLWSVRLRSRFKVFRRGDEITATDSLAYRGAKTVAVSVTAVISPPSISYGAR